MNTIECMTGFSASAFGIAPSNPNAIVKCRGLQIYSLGTLGFQHCDAQVTDCGGTVHLLSAGLTNPNGTGYLQAWNTSNPTMPFIGTTVYSGQMSCSDINGLTNFTDAWNTLISNPAIPADAKMNYNAIMGPNSNMWLQSAFWLYGRTWLPINGWGSIW